MYLEVFDEMNFTDKQEHRFSVYVHISPSGKRYVGITSQAVTVRWGMNGNGYKDNKHFYAAIQKYGWDNFQHCVVATDLDLVAASEMESNLISHYDTMNPNKGYNNTTGGNWSSPSDSVRDLLRQRTSARWKDAEYRARMCEIQKNLPHSSLSELHKLHISQATRGRSSPLKGKKLSESHKLKMKGRIPWNRGLSAKTSISIRSAVDKLKRREVSDETKEKMKQSRHLLFENGYTPTWANNGDIEIQVDVSTQTLPEGFNWGRLPSIYVTRDAETKKIHPTELDTYLAHGWTKGKSETVNYNIKKSHQEFVWTFDNVEFESAISLAAYLRNHGYPKIVGSTITDLYRRGFEHSKLYSSLSDKIHRRAVHT